MRFTELNEGIQCLPQTEQEKNIINVVINSLITLSPLNPFYLLKSHQSMLENMTVHYDATVASACLPKYVIIYFFS